MITVKYPSGRSERRQFALVSGESPIGSARPIPDESTLELMDGCITITAAEGDSDTKVWPWHMIKELDLGPKVSETVLLREGR